MESAYCIVINTCPDKESALEIANNLVAEKLAACVSALPKVTSVYPWAGKVETSDEIMLLIKTRQDTYPALEVRLQELHPYELPEIISVPITSGLPPYLQWITESLNK